MHYFLRHQWFTKLQETSFSLLFERKLDDWGSDVDDEAMFQFQVLIKLSFEKNVMMTFRVLESHELEARESSVVMKEKKTR